ncbi:MAG: hypothetical protein IKM38_06310 [Christensenellaceae bacterium]|nr:hypothetical protein [Christensenellaceae bacterium]
MKRLLSWILIIVTLCSLSVSCRGENKSALHKLYKEPFDENLDPYELLDDFSDNHTRLEEIKLTEYELSEFEEFFAGRDPQDEMNLRLNYNKLPLRELNDRFPVQILRQCKDFLNPDFHGYYVPYKLTDGSYVYIFIRAIPTDNYRLEYQDYAEVWEVYHFDGSYVAFEELLHFDHITEDEEHQLIISDILPSASTLEDLYRIENEWFYSITQSAYFYVEGLTWAEGTLKMFKVYFRPDWHTVEKREDTQRENYYIYDERYEEIDPDFIYLQIFESDLPENVPDEVRKYYPILP